MRWRWLWWSAVVLCGLQALLASTATAEEQVDALSLEKPTLDLLTRRKRGFSEAILGFVDKAWSVVQPITNIIFKYKDDAEKHLAEKKLLSAFEDLSNRLDQIENSVNGIENSVRDLANGMQHMVRWENALNTMEEYIWSINTLYKRFRLLHRMKDKIEDHTLMDFANVVVSHDSTSVMSLMGRLHSLAVPKAAHQTAALGGAVSISAWNVKGRVTRKMVLQEKLITENMDDSNQPKKRSLRPSLFRMFQDVSMTSNNCNLRQSPQQMMDRLHTILALTEARGFSMLEFAWMLFRMNDKGNFTIEQEMAKQLYLQYSADILHEAKTVMEQLPRDFYRCDPRHHREGETYIQLTELLQGYIENEVDMTAHGTCKQNCAAYQHAKSEGCYLPSSQYCGKHRRCKGTIHDCKYYDADATVCISKNPYRRYDFITYENRKHLGSRQRCEGTEMKVDSWWRFLYHCSYCLCLCDDGNSPSSDRYISLVPAISDIQNNMVVTGVRFIKQRQVIHIQIQQGQALPQGQINSTTIQWVKTEPIQVKSEAYTEGQDYKKLSFEDRSIDLDRLEGPKDHAVTGVRFRMLGSHINLEVKITPINYTTGVMQPDKSYWISNDNTPAMARSPRGELQLHSPDDPTKFPALSKIDSRPDTFMRFVPTDRVKDVAQLTVPFFDSQTVAPAPGTWLSGIELFHKGQPGSGGFLAMKVMNYDMTLYMEGSSNEPRTVVLPESQ